jgi:predicted P-loop ATPase
MGIEDLRDTWREKMPCLTPTRQPKAVLANALFALREAPEWAGVLAYDEFALTTVTMQPPPWCRGGNDWKSVQWKGCDDVLATEWLQREGIDVPLNVTASAVETVARGNSFHPIRDYLGGLKWNGIDRLETFATDYLGTEDTSYNTAVGRCIFISAVARVFEPGCKVDHVAVLEAEQGAFKSSAVDALFSPWFSDELAELGSKDAAMQARVAWGIEIAELTSMRKGEVERIKAFIARSVDRFRPSYGRRVIEVPRQCVFVGTTNSDGYLKDETGARRFWPLQCRCIKLKAIKRDRDQLWAEAVTLYRKGEPWWLTDVHDIAAAREEQADRYADDAWEAIIAKRLNGKDDTSVAEILADVLRIEEAHWTQADQNRVARCLTVHGWHQYWARVPTRGRRYCRKDRGQCGHR